jgi:hypothetical protein
LTPEPRTGTIRDVAQQRRQVTLAKTQPGQPDRADEILDELAKHVSVQSAVDRTPDNPFVAVDAGEGVSFEEAGRRTTALLDEIDEQWSEHLIVVEPQPKTD